MKREAVLRSVEYDFFIIGEFNVFYLAEVNGVGLLAVCDEFFSREYTAVTGGSVIVIEWPSF